MDAHGISKAFQASPASSKLDLGKADIFIETPQNKPGSSALLAFSWGNVPGSPFHRRLLLLLLLTELMHNTLDIVREKFYMIAITGNQHLNLTIYVNISLSKELQDCSICKDLPMMMFCLGMMVGLRNISIVAFAAHPRTLKMAGKPLNETTFDELEKDVFTPRPFMTNYRSLADPLPVILEAKVKSAADKQFKDWMNRADQRRPFSDYLRLDLSQRSPHPLVLQFPFQSIKEILAIEAGSIEKDDNEANQPPVSTDSHAEATQIVVEDVVVVVEEQLLSHQDLFLRMADGSELKLKTKNQLCLALSCGHSFEIVTTGTPSQKSFIVIELEAAKPSLFFFFLLLMLQLHLSSLFCTSKDLCCILRVPASQNPSMALQSIKECTKRFGKVLRVSTLSA